MRGKIGMDTNKALVLNDRGHLFFFSFLFFFFLVKTNFASSRTKSVFIVLDSSLLVMSSLCAFYPKMRTGGRHFKVDKTKGKTKRFVENE